MTPEAVEAGAPLHLLAWLSPAFPIGAFAYSHGLESAVDQGHVHDALTLQSWLQDILEHGAARSDTVLAKAAWVAAQAADPAAMREANDLALALAPSRERRLETATTGQAFAGAIRASWPDAVCAVLPDGEVAYPVAFGAACATERLALRPCLEAYLLATVQNLVSAAIRLGPVGQTDGQRTTAALLPAIKQVAGDAMAATLDDVGGCAFRSDLSALHHETLYSRLFRS